MGGTAVHGKRAGKRRTSGRLVVACCPRTCRSLAGKFRYSGLHVQSCGFPCGAAQWRRLQGTCRSGCRRLGEPGAEGRKSTPTRGRPSKKPKDPGPLGGTLQRRQRAVLQAGGEGRRRAPAWEPAPSGPFTFPTGCRTCVPLGCHGSLACPLHPVTTRGQGGTQREFAPQGAARRLLNRDGGLGWTRRGKREEKKCVTKEESAP